ncbi:hypothetical protein DFH06DRAFT_1308299 [Mycena polygramma]|nr:hypothetical protein DFH06DRAFT_1308299 [Mycena polygramma]
MMESPNPIERRRQIEWFEIGFEEPSKGSAAVSIARCSGITHDSNELNAARGSFVSTKTGRVRTATVDQGDARDPDLSKIDARKWTRYGMVKVLTNTKANGGGGAANHRAAWTKQPKALEAGLLRAILGAGKTTGVEHTQLKYILRVNLPGSMVYYSVLAQLQTALADPELKSMLPDLVPDVRTQYTTFLRLALERIAIKKEYDLPQRSSYLACDNMDCGKIAAKSDFRRCSGCRQRHYCCSKCQVLDWNVADGHRVYCVGLAFGANLYIEPGGGLKTITGGSNLSKRDVSFLRTLVHHDYNNVRVIMRTQQMLQDSRTVCFTYIKTGMDGNVYVSAGIDRANAVQMQQAAWPHEVDWQARLKRGGGRIDVHLVFVSEGQATRIHLIPLRSSDGAISHRLDQLSRMLPVGTTIEQLMDRFPQICGEVEDLLDTDVVEIH